MNRAEAIEFAKEQQEIFGGKMGEFLKFVENELTQTTGDDLIRRQAAIDSLYPIRCNLQMMDDTYTADKVMHGLWLAENAIKQLPSAEPQRKKGKWILSADRGCATCSECNDRVYFLYNYCPNCGAKMEGDDE